MTFSEIENDRFTEFLDWTNFIEFKEKAP